MTYYAIPPEGCSDYLTPGERYKILGCGWDEDGLTDPEPFDPEQHDNFTLGPVPGVSFRLFCLVKGCAHANGDWEIVKCE